jgi:zinc transport system ATP-binding protein
MNKTIVEIKDVSFAFNGQSVLRGVNLEIRRGDFIAMIGPNGGGKTTLLKLILGLIKPDKGIIRVMGDTAEKSSPFIGYVPQHIHVNRSFPISALDVVLMGKLAPKRRFRRTSTRSRQEALDALEQMGMSSYAQRKIGELSGGQRQRIFIARALATQPKLLLLDEPTANIDSQGQAEFFNLLKMLNKNITIVVVSHDLMVISTYVKSVACVNKCLHYHGQAEITGDMLQAMYPYAIEEVCPVELVAHGVPHRVLKKH